MTFVEKTKDLLVEALSLPPFDTNHRSRLGYVTRPELAETGTHPAAWRATVVTVVLLRCVSTCRYRSVDVVGG